jgi:hypothetical protein
MLESGFTCLCGLAENGVLSHLFAKEATPA